MNAANLREQLAQAQATIQTLQDELTETNRGLVALTLELDDRVQERTAEWAQANAALCVKIAEHRRAELALAESEKRFGTLFQTMSEGFAIHEIIYNEAGDAYDLRYIEINPAFERHTGVKAADIQGRTILELFPAVEPVWFERYVKVALTGEPAHFQSQFGPLGRWFKVSAYRTEPGRFATVFFDITERKEMEVTLMAARDEAQSLARVKSTFLATMSHEIRTPLHVIIGLGHRLRREVKDAAPQARLDQLCATSDHLLAIINDVLDLSKIEAQRLTLEHNDFRLDAVLEKVVRIVEGQAHDKGLTLTTDIAPRLRDMALNGDALRLAQVLINLCGNAVKFTDRGAVHLCVVCLAEDADGVALRFIVEDTGIGIAPADQTRLFQAFEQADGSTTRERGGTGLGLSISQRLVALMGGTIRLHSQPAAGSTFSFELTLPRGIGVANAPVPVSATPKFFGARVLVAEDHPINQEIILELLESLGCEVEIAGDGAEALECARAATYDLIMMDVRMPRMDGLEATRAIRSLPQHQSTPILAVTASAFSEDRERCLEAGMNGSISKPFTRATLAACIKQWLPDLDASTGDTPAHDDAPSPALSAMPDPAAGCPIRRSANQLVGSASLLHRYVELHEHDMDRLDGHLAAGDRHAACGVVHKLKGISGFIGAKSIAALASDIDAALRTGADAHAVASMTAICAAELANLAAAVRGLPPEGVANCSSCPDAFAQAAFCLRAADPPKLKGMDLEQVPASGGARLPRLAAEDGP